MSAGLDSRSILGGLDPAKCKGVTLNTFSNREYAYTCLLSASSKVHLHTLQRNYSFYYDNIYDSIAMSYGMTSFNQDHYAGEVLDQLRGKFLVSGCYFDYFLKDLASDSKNILNE